MHVETIQKPTKRGVGAGPPVSILHCSTGVAGAHHAGVHGGDHHAGTDGGEHYGKNPVCGRENAPLCIWQPCFVRCHRPQRRKNRHHIRRNPAGEAVPEGTVLFHGGNRTFLHRQPHHPLHQRYHPDTDADCNGASDAGESAHYGSLGDSEDCG